MQCDVRNNRLVVAVQPQPLDLTLCSKHYKRVVRDKPDQRLLQDVGNRILHVDSDRPVEQDDELVSVATADK